MERRATQGPIQELLKNHSEELVVSRNALGCAAPRAAKNIWVLFLVPILAVFFLRDAGT